MNNKSYRLTYQITTGLLTIMALMFVGNSNFNPEFSALFSAFGYPNYIIRPLSIAILLGLVTIWSNKSPILKEWAYAGFFFNFVLATAAHLKVNDSGFFFPLVGLLLLLSSYYFWKKASVQRPIPA